MILSILYLIGGLLLILYGANRLTGGAASLAKRYGISDLVIGLTVVAFGTSAPELVISVISAINGNAELAIGNVVGSNIFNMLAITGVVALVRPIKMESSIITNDIPLVVLSALVILVMGNKSFLDGTQQEIISRSNGIILLFFFAIFMRYTFAQAKSPLADSTHTEKIEQKSIFITCMDIIGGLAALILGGSLFVEGASDLALAIGVSEAIVGLTIVAAGTSLPELATSVTAAVKGNPGIALGNVIGSNIFNIFLVLGCSATVRPLSFGDIGNVDLLTLAGGCLLFWLFGFFFRSRTITRIEGGLMLGCYIAYTIFLIFTAT